MRTPASSPASHRASPADDVLERVLEADVSPAGAPAGVLICTICGVVDGDAIVDVAAYGGTPALRVQTALVAITAEDVGREACITFARGAWEEAVLLGLIARPSAAGACAVPTARIELVAERELLLKCGAAMLHLTADGTVRIRGTHIVSHARGTNRLRGGAVQIN
ncbi:MAG: hypothetical protein MUF00_06300 [Gemmatimonadaceae bacterium]|jgi:hypothetical protein|nr:hypothetical protein [Gemmatimonadaceae bacterium]